MSYVWVRVQVARLTAAVVLLLLAAGCTIELPVGRIACGGDAECPDRFYCSEYLRRCFPRDVDAGQRTRIIDAGGMATDADEMLDAGGGDAAHDSGSRDAGPVDSGRAAHDARRPDDPSEPGRPTHDSGKGSPTGMNELPAQIDLPLPACGSEPDAANAYFVSAGVGDDVANCGGPTGPCKSIHKALQRAQDNGVKLVYLDNTDLYTESETLELPAGVIVLGGFSNVNGRWTRLCDAAHGKTRLLSTANPVLRAEYAGASRVLSLSLETRAAAESETLIGVFAFGTETQLWLEGVSIVAADGGAGAAGVPGAPAAVASASCAVSDGADAAIAGTSGLDAVSGSFGPTGYIVSDGAAGTDGMAGNAGVAGPEPVCFSCILECNCDAGLPMTCGKPGIPGCGGAAGGGGGGGHGGGSSVALYVWDAEVHVKGGRLQAGSGGSAGDGGAAGSGAAGAAGTQGDTGLACMNCRNIAVPGGPVCIASGTLESPGTQAGSGGRGTDGGPGGAGAGGHAYAAYGGGAAAKLTIDPDVELAVGQAGTSSSGAPGLAASIGP